MNVVKIARGQQNLHAQRRRIAVIGFFAICVALAALYGRMPTKSSLTASAPVGSPAAADQTKSSLPNAYELSQLKRRATRSATNADQQGADEREYYRTALRLLRRLSDVHSRL
jgi:hypothetical protein